VETYGLTVYAPHFDVSAGSPYRVARVGPTRPSARNPLVGVEEVQGEIADVEVRRPDVLVISEGFANAYVVPERGDGRTLSTVIEERQGDRPTATFVASALADRLPHYRVRLVARPHLPALARALGLSPQKIQSTTGIAAWVLARTDGPARSLPSRQR
jgi:hypothetical protein